ncbi:MAG: phospholipase [Methylobacterium sp.]|nr:MAG: phospholipase [Methylobacterium sp.]
MPRPLDGPRLRPASGQARALVVFMHGYGADGNDLIGLGQNWQEILPDAAFISPHAPEPCGMSPAGRQWWELTFRDPGERWRGVNQVQADVDSFLDAELARHGLPANRLVLVGFSQGAMTALHVGLRRRVPPAAIIGYSGHLVGGEHLKEQATGRPPILLVHGDQDNVIPVDALFDAMASLGKAEIPCQWHLSIGVGHGIDPDGLRHGGEFIAQNLPR